MSNSVRSYLGSLLIPVSFRHQINAILPSMPKNQQRKNQRSRQRLPRQLPLVAAQPSSRRVLVSYGTAANLNEAAAGVGSVVFYRLNSVYDPDLTGVGTAALGLGYWANFFQSYRVLKATVRFQGTPTNMSAGGLATFIMGAVPQSTMPATKQAWRATPTAKMGVAVNAAQGGKNVVTMTATYDMAKVLRVSKASYMNDMDYSGGTASNPARAVNLFLSIDSCGSSSVVQSAYNLQITYEVLWFNPLPVQ